MINIIIEKKYLRKPNNLLVVFENKSVVPKTKLGVKKKVP